MEEQMQAELAAVAARGRAVLEKDLPSAQSAMAAATRAIATIEASFDHLYDAMQTAEENHGSGSEEAEGLIRTLTELEQKAAKEGRAAPPKVLELLKQAPVLKALPATSFVEKQTAEGLQEKLRTARKERVAAQGLLWDTAARARAWHEKLLHDEAAAARKARAKLGAGLTVVSLEQKASQALLKHEGEPLPADADPLGTTAVDPEREQFGSHALERKFTPGEGYRSPEREQFGSHALEKKFTPGEGDRSPEREQFGSHAFEKKFTPGEGYVSPVASGLEAASALRSAHQDFVATGSRIADLETELRDLMSSLVGTGGDAEVDSKVKDLLEPQADREYRNAHGLPWGDAWDHRSTPTTLRPGASASPSATSTSTSTFFPAE